eukprot:TRINITY_DN9874_c0_g1_i1.p1 TRINITY_DN9874_c0_g1~~TRINITY_DN9874_c0_g1_i1.p1  ORF type:complete len:261 (-),score=48.58 TRINITY_DN9874_c0_g1_i1:65-742(-)
MTSKLKDFSTFCKEIETRSGRTLEKLVAVCNGSSITVSDQDLLDDVIQYFRENAVTPAAAAVTPAAAAAEPVAGPAVDALSPLPVEASVAIVELPLQVVHQGISCNDCGVRPIIGTRYKCTVCYNYDLCPECQASERYKDSHAPRHPVVKFEQVRTASGEVSEHENVILKCCEPNEEAQQEKLRLFEFIGQDMAQAAETLQQCDGNVFLAMQRLYSRPAAVDQQS